MSIDWQNLRVFVLAAALIVAGLPDLSRAEDFVGLVHASREVTLSVGVGGVVARLNVVHGQRVKIGRAHV